MSSEELFVLNVEIGQLFLVTVLVGAAMLIALRVFCPRPAKIWKKARALVPISRPLPPRRGFR